MYTFFILFHHTTMPHTEYIFDIVAISFLGVDVVSTKFMVHCTVYIAEGSNIRITTLHTTFLSTFVCCDYFLYFHFRPHSYRNKKKSVGKRNCVECNRKEIAIMFQF